MEMIATIAAGVALGVLIAAGALYASYRNWSTISGAALSVGRWLLTLKWWFAGAAGIAFVAFVIVQTEAEKQRRAVERAQQKQREEAWRLDEEKRKRMRAQCDAERKALRERCEPIIAAAEASRKKGDLLRFDKDVFDCELKLKGPARLECWLP